MTRKDALAHITIAGYHSDQRAALRFYTENRVSFEAYSKAFARGAELKQQGTPCTCYQCNR